MHNKNGYLTAKISGTDTTKYSYDNFGNLISVTLPDGKFIEYLVDANNRRIGKKVDGVVISRWIYSGELTPAAELDSLGNVTARYVYGKKTNVPDYYFENDTTYKIITDHLGSVKLVINLATGEIIQEFNFTEFGDVLTHTGEAELPFGYAGGLYDEQTGLVRFGARDYDSHTGRWTAKDPILFEGGDENLYRYVLSDPLNKTDIKGTTLGITQMDLIKTGAVSAMVSAGMSAAMGDSWEQIIMEGVVGFSFGYIGGFMVSSVVTAAGTPLQWMRVGRTFSQSGGFKTWGVAFGSNDYWRFLIGDERLKTVNQALRDWRLPWDSWRTADPGHFHFWLRF